MSVSFFIDQCVPFYVGESLRQASYQTEILRDHLPIDAKDPEVIACAQTLNAVLVTLNGDFADIINYPPAKFGGITCPASEKPSRNTTRNRYAVADLSGRTPRT